MYSTFGFVTNGIFAIFSSIVIFPIYTISYFLFGGKKADQSDLRKHIAIVTGGNTGIGKYTAINLVRRGCTVIIACRDPSRAAEAVNDITRLALSSSSILYPYRKEGKVEYMHLDLGVLPSIVDFARKFKEKYSTLDFLINNGGVNTKGTLSLGTHRIEQLFGVNYLGHYFLLRQLLDLLQTPVTNRETPSRVINLSSVTHHQGSSKFIDSCYYPVSKHAYAGCSPYADSKLYMNYLTLEINRRYSGSFFPSINRPTLSKRSIISLSANPGAVKSDIWRSVPSFIRFPYDIFMSIFYLTTEQGSDTTVSACVLPLKEIIERSTTSQFRSNGTHSDSLLINHPLIPYLIPYRMYWRCLAFEMINAFSGSNWGYVSIPGEADRLSLELWNFSCDIINNSGAVHEKLSYDKYLR